MAEPALDAGPRPPSPPDDPPAAGRRETLPWYLATTSSWFGGWGMYQVLFPWLVVGVLGASAETTGLTQMSVLLSNLTFLLVGGALADRLEARGLLTVLHLGAVVPIGILWASVVGDWLSLPVLIGCGVMIGLCSAFNVPARDSLLREVAGDDVGRTVTGVTAVQFGSQLVGMAIAGATKFIGTPVALLIQACILGSGAVAARRLPRRPPRVHGGEALSASEMTRGVRIVWSSPLRPVFLLIAGVGLFFMGSYHVIFPLLIRDVYQGSSAELSLLMGMFPLGAILGSLALLRRRSIRRKGRALAIALAAGGGFLVVGGMDLPYPGLVATTLGWGLCGSVFMNMSRTLFQERAPEAERARVLAVNQLGFLGAAPIGSILSGYAAATLGPSLALSALGAAMWVLVAVVLLTTPVLHME